VTPSCERCRGSGICGANDDYAIELWYCACPAGRRAADLDLLGDSGP